MAITEHLEESRLALYVLGAPEVQDRRKEIASHLADCAGCADLVEKIRDYYEDVEKIEQAEAPAFLPSLDVSGQLVRKTGGESAVPIIPGRRPTFEVVISSFRTYPVRWTGAFALVAAALMLVVPKIVTIDASPAYLRAKDECLVALNKNGEELWRKLVVPGFDLKTSKTTLTNFSVLEDVDGDGKKEAVLLSPHPEAPPESYQATSIRCFNADGNDRWIMAYHPVMTFDSVEFSGDYLIQPPLGVRDFDRNGKYSVVFVAHHATWWPAVVGMLDANNGKPIAEYWHPGWVKLAIKDIDGDGREEILAVGYNNAFKKNVLAVLDPHKSAGHAPAATGFTPKDIEAAAEKFYILLPDPDLFGLSLRLPGENNSGIEESSGLVIRTTRYLTDGKRGDCVAEVFFEFDGHMNCVRVRGGDEFVALHHDLEKAGKLSRKIEEGYFEKMRRGVQYWDGGKFVKEPTMNKKYVSSK